MISKDFWSGRKVFITGHTGFKGSWLSIWLTSLGADVTGYALSPQTDQNLFDLAKVEDSIHHNTGDIRDLEKLYQAMKMANPEIIFHMAAQPLVQESYKNPIETYSTNVMGTVHLFEAVKKLDSVKAVINVTTDKCYENKEWIWGYREIDSLGGHDPYSSSKACSELVTASYRNSYFHPEQYNKHGVAIASARAGNVIGGGDRANHRLIPDCIRSLSSNLPIEIRNPNSIRPWQHVLEPLSGYLILAQKLVEEGPKYGDAWNFGPNDNDARTVEEIVKKFCSLWGNGGAYKISKGVFPHEAQYLKLDCSKAKMLLEWQPKWNVDNALSKIVEWEQAQSKKHNIVEFCVKQIREYQETHRGVT